MSHVLQVAMYSPNEPDASAICAGRIQGLAHE